MSIILQILICFADIYYANIKKYVLYNQIGQTYFNKIGANIYENLRF